MVESWFRTMIGTTFAQIDWADHRLSLMCIGVASVILLFGLYRLFYHPLTKFPGPFLAALTVWYEFYYDGIQRGQYTFQIQRMHEKYGPIVRISPNELHVNDPAFIDELYTNGSSPRDKYEYFASQFGFVSMAVFYGDELTAAASLRKSGFGTVSHKLHRIRRGAMSRFFSKASVTKLEPMIHEKIEKLCSQLKTHAGSKSPVQISMAFSCMTTDVVTDYAFNRCYNFLDSRTFEPNLHRAIVAGTDMGPYIKQFPWIFPLMKALPDSLVTLINPEMGVYLQFQKDIRAQIRQIQQGEELPSEKHSTIFHELLQGDLPDQEKRLERLWQEGQIIVGAGTETTAWTLSVIIFYLLSNPEIFDTLYKKLVAAIPDPDERISSARLENLPYLISLRLSYGVSTRLQRISPHSSMRFRSTLGPSKIEYEIPAGTPVGMTSVLVHLNSDLFPRPLQFDPSRWLDADGRRDPRLERYLLSFSCGSRQCLGINLAYAELFMGVGLLIRRLGPQLELFETTKDDVEIHHDCFVATPKVGTKGIRITVKSEVEDKYKY